MLTLVICGYDEKLLNADTRTCLPQYEPMRMKWKEGKRKERRGKKERREEGRKEREKEREEERRKEH